MKLVGINRVLLSHEFLRRAEPPMVLEGGD